MSAFLQLEMKPSLNLTITYDLSTVLTLCLKQSINKVKDHEKSNGNPFYRDTI